MTEPAVARDWADAGNDMGDAVIAASFAKSEPKPQWVPDMSVLGAGRRKAVPMPGDLFGSRWDLLKDIANGAGCPVDYAALGFLTASASLIGGKRRVRAFAGQDWTEPAIIWTGAVGDPSSNKSPGLEAVTTPLRKIEREHAEGHKESLRLFETDRERAKAEKAAWAEAVKSATKDGLATPAMPVVAVEPDEPRRRRLIVTDATPEAMGAILSGNRAGTLHFRDELSGWLLGFERYAPGGREFWLEAYGGRPFVIDRKGSTGPITVDFTGVSVVGGIQPDKVSSVLLSGVDDGLVARFLWAWPESIPFRRPTASGDRSRLEAIYRKLDGLTWGYDANGEEKAITLDLDPDASDLFEAWAVSNDQGIDDAGSLYKNFCGKLKGLVLRLSLVAELMAWADEGGPEPVSVSKLTVGAVTDFIDDYAKPTAQRVYGDAALPQADRDAAVIARHIIRHKLRRFNAKKLRRESGFNGPKDANRLADALAVLDEYQWVKADGTRAGDTPGRKSSDYTVNAGVHAGG